MVGLKRYKDKYIYENNNTFGIVSTQHILKFFNF